MSRYVSAEERAGILAMIADGATVAMIMRETGRGRRVAERLGARSPRGPRTPHAQYAGVETNMSRLAEAISEGMTISQAARHIGVGERAGFTMFNRMRRRLGAQAV